MNILHVVRGLRHSSGTTTTVVPLSEQQARLGHSVTVYYVEQGAAAPLLPDPRLVHSRGLPMSLPLWHPGISIDFARVMHATIGHFDIVHIHAVWNFPTWWAMRIALQSQVPYIVSPQGSFDPWALRQGEWRKAAYRQLVEIPLMNQAAFMQALTDKEAEQFHAAGITAPSIVIPNAVDPSALGQPTITPPGDTGLETRRRTILSLSRLHKKKGIDILMRGFAAISSVHQDTDLAIAGSDGGSGYGDELQTLARHLGVRERTHFIGEVKGDAKRAALASADCFALISHSEGLPVACLEAMAAGLPLLITPGCNLPEVADAGAGLVVKCGPGEVATGLERLLSDRQAGSRMGRRGRALVEQKFTWPIIARQTIAAYDRAIGGADRLRRAS